MDNFCYLLCDHQFEQARRSGLGQDPGLPYSKIYSRMCIDHSGSCAISRAFLKIPFQTKTSTSAFDGCVVGWDSDARVMGHSPAKAEWHLDLPADTIVCAAQQCGNRGRRIRTLSTDLSAVICRHPIIESFRGCTNTHCACDGSPRGRWKLHLYVSVRFFALRRLLVSKSLVAIQEP